jgi:ubiquitin-protein ligase
MKNSQRELFTEALELLAALARHAQGRDVLVEPLDSAMAPDGASAAAASESLRSLLAELQAQAKVFLGGFEASARADGGAAADSGGGDDELGMMNGLAVALHIQTVVELLAAIPAPSEAPPTPAAEAAAATQAAEGAEGVAEGGSSSSSSSPPSRRKRRSRGGQAAASAAASASSAASEAKQSRPHAAAAAAGAAAAAATHRAAAAYSAALKDLQLDEAEGLAGNAHAFAQLQSQGQGARGSRLLRQVSVLATSLPLDIGSSVFVRYDSQRFSSLRACISGPAGTPYEKGLFFFDIFLPSEFPAVPPKVQFLTTGAGRVRFNPNLYENGKVCLSLLGTWAGPGWIPNKSSLIQVLVSIQSLILVRSTKTFATAFVLRQLMAKNDQTVCHDQLRLLVAMISETTVTHVVLSQMVWGRWSSRTSMSLHSRRPSAPPAAPSSPTRESSKTNPSHGQEPLPCLALPCLALPCRAVSCLALPCLRVLYCIALRCLALPCTCRYNREIRRATLAHAILGILKSPPPFFEEIVARHFAHIGPSLLEVVGRWAADEKAVSKGEKGIMARGLSSQSEPLGAKQIAELKKLLAKLPPVTT